MHIYYVNDPGGRPILRPVAEHAGSYIVRKDKYLYTPPVDVEFPPDAAIIYVCADPIHAQTDIPAAELLKAHNDASNMMRFDNPPWPDGEPAKDGVALFVLAGFEASSAATRSAGVPRVSR